MVRRDVGTIAWKTVKGVGGFFVTALYNSWSSKKPNIHPMVQRI